jgi:predicted amidohydrolase YtcJ
MRRALSAESVVTSAGTIGDTVLFENGMVTAVGMRSELSMDGYDHIEYPGGFIVPGLRDAHIHAIPYASLLSGCSLKSATSIADLTGRLRAFADSLPAGAPIVAFRLDDETLEEQRLPNRDDLDRAIPNRPVVIYRYCGHIAVANSFALSESGVDASTPDPEGGLIDRDAEGRPTGVMRETAMAMMTGALGRGAAIAPETAVDGLTRLAGLGLTSIGAMIGYGESPSETLAAESELLHSISDNLPLRVHALSIAATPDSLAGSARTLADGGERLRWLGVKRFADGSLGGHTAAMCSPFADEGTTGTLRLTAQDVEVSRHSLNLGGMVAIHAIGDRAIGEVLDVFNLLIFDGASPRDLRMEHVSVASPDLINRFARSGAIAVVQPAFLASEESWLGKRLGDDRLDWAYPFASMSAAGITLAGSSDSTVEPPNPLWGMAAAMDRHGIGPDQKLTGLQALHMFTDGGAVALREPRPLAIGSPADIAVIDVNMSTASAKEVKEANVLDTYVGGVAVEVNRSLPTWVD